MRDLHSLCAAEAFQEVSASADADVVEGNTMCSVSCSQFSKIEGLTTDIIKAEEAELVKKKNEEAQEQNVMVNRHKYGASHDAPREAIVA